jgi:hypothetical protein
MGGMAKRDRKPQARPELPEKLQRAIDQKRSDGVHREPRPNPRTAPHRQGASRGPRG